MIKYTKNQSEETPLIFSFPEGTERIKRKETRRNIFITLVVVTFVALIVTLVVVFQPHQQHDFPIFPPADPTITNTNNTNNNYNNSQNDSGEALVEDSDVDSDGDSENKTEIKLLKLPPISPTLLGASFGGAQAGNEKLKSEFNNLRRSPVVEVEQGKVEGIIVQSRQGRDYFTFYSVPYGKPPVGQLRFEPPEPAEKWPEDVYDASAIRTVCIPVKKPDKDFEGSEDCLHLHVNTPKLPSSESDGAEEAKEGTALLPVMVYILGGAFKTGKASRYSAKYFMDEDVVLVFVDFRLGAFGHLNTGDSVIRGNLSFKDQVLALKWIQRNIVKFGGDSKRVVIFGNSSGGMSVHAHLLSNMSKGLFSGAISESGAVIGSNVPNACMTNPGIIAQSLAKELDCPLGSNRTRELAQCLRALHPYKIASVDRPDIVWDLTREFVDARVTDPAQTFLADTPLNLMRRGKVSHVPWITGINSREKFGDAYDLIRSPEAIRSLNANFTQLVMEDILRIYEANNSTEIETKIKDFYFGNSSAIIDATFRKELGDLLSDSVWVHPTRVAGMLHSQYSPVYFYYFSKEPTESHQEDQKYNFPPPHGAAHGDEVQYFFEYERFPEITMDSPDFEFSKDFIKIWVSFAKNGFPDGTIAHGGQTGGQWNRIRTEQNGMKWFEINDRNRQSTEPFTERMTFWDSLPFTLLYES